MRKFIAKIAFEDDPKAVERKLAMWTPESAAKLVVEDAWRARPDLGAADAGVKLVDEDTAEVFFFDVRVEPRLDVEVRPVSKEDCALRISEFEAMENAVIHKRARLNPAFPVCGDAKAAERGETILPQWANSSVVSCPGCRQALGLEGPAVEPEPPTVNERTIGAQQSSWRPGSSKEANLPMLLDALREEYKQGPGIIPIRVSPIQLKILFAGVELLRTGHGSGLSSIAGLDIGELHTLGKTLEALQPKAPPTSERLADEVLAAIDKDLAQDSRHDDE